MNGPYLKITLHDNDFTSYWLELGEAIQGIIRFECNNFETKSVEGKDIEAIKPYIAKLWWAINSLSGHFRWKGSPIDQKPTKMDVFDGVDVEIIDYVNIPEWDNAESIYIPLFKETTEIICR